MAKTYTYPHWEISVEDKSIANVVVTETLPLFRPIFFARAQRGPVGVPVWVSSYTDAVEMFGAGTFDDSTPYYSREAIFLKQLFARQGAMITRLASPDASYGSMVLTLKVQATTVPQFMKDEDGNFILDPDTEEPMPEMDSTGMVQATADGYELTWATRVLADDETIDSMQPTTYGTGTDAYTVYPMLAVKATSVGAYANDIGIKLFVDTYTDLDTDLINTIDALQYTFGIVEKTYGQDTVSAVRSNFGYDYQDVFVKPSQQDARIASNVSFNEVLDSKYGSSILPFSYHLYSENFETVGRLIMDVEDDDTLTDPYMVNLTEAVNINGNPYSCMVLNDDSIMLSNSWILYMDGGSDGDYEDAAIETLTRQYLDDDIYPELKDQARYPFTHIIDTGVTIDTKKSFIAYLGKHDAFKVVLSTQDVSMPANDKDADLSMGRALYTAALLQPESVIKGTECCRAEIIQHCGYLADESYLKILPLTLDIMVKKSRWQSTESITGIAAGLPNAAITLFKDWNWAATDADHQQTSWDAGLNYLQFYDMTSIHWPCLRTVYREETSVLSSATFTDVIVYAKHICRYNWARLVGTEDVFSMYSSKMEKYLTNDLNVMVNGRYPFSVTAYQTDEDATLGYRSHVQLEITGNPQQRVSLIDIVCYRSGYGDDD